MESDRESSDGFEIVLQDTEDTQINSDLFVNYTEDDKPWNRPGEDITDYFNYGFNEHTWKEYIAKQKRLREKAKKKKK
ncbi:hypothetical protein NEPAR06_0465 [Nematocida parisii]|uniref:uncharacterized protein n=1 Tax=Nematocida parisii (strain ERTm1 / ATCC PRA-289) TaxID=881290 RepID=UPI000264B908|nr:uncharacterized protein NEPG_01136 [Nematocida parisii ERTm1]KAI5127409.1 hypothetical protein NEPAR08_0850 [Nematocida parisii]KAI5168232.1 hypothetical protein NEIRO02_2495 [Nematocida sp. AWRm79]KAI5187321.1 hypothetical protein NEIRO03_2506 [Nematocida sp. AWRm78]OAG32349.1 hypothetical protein NEIG_02277 [Nematocida sp. ERTm5]EIJ94468.1 hypothetical protein NEPG_01136 [Nematocida parisii ERTm1]|eukprot:XP_013058964.1 hypothetical protein NEPG_01136 [Nematocida parisii ERTm1]